MISAQSSTYILQIPSPSKDIKVGKQESALHLTSSPTADEDLCEEDSDVDWPATAAAVFQTGCEVVNLARGPDRQV